MTGKNKKGKKKNKMAGRHGRPDCEQTPEREDVKIVVLASDTSEADESLDARQQSPVSSTTLATTPTCDSGVDSGRGSPGDEPGITLATGDKADTVEGKPLSNELDQTSAVGELEHPQLIEMEPEVMELPKEFGEEVAIVSESSVNVQPKTQDAIFPKDKVEANPVCRKMNVVKSSNEVEKPKSPREAPTKNSYATMEDIWPADLKHPLEFVWQLWLLDLSKDWEYALEPRNVFDTVEDYWRNFHMLRSPIASNTKSFLMFKRGIKPEYEDPKNSHGLRWNIMQGFAGPKAETMWRELSLMLVGGIDFAETTVNINGLYCAGKSDGAHFSVWLDNDNMDIAERIGRVVQRILREQLNTYFAMELIPCRTKFRKRPLLVLK